ncbi:MAG: hypothetical protein NXH99_02070 [Rhodobacteraceae bacterium]|nr:hypothetical protein [Paracoccaceae bacterium]
MPSFNVVNYSLRPSKSIQRSIIFENYKQIHSSLSLTDIVYIGFGSIWFTDFITAHKSLDVNDMISIEANEIGFKRAEFNRPFKSISIFNELSTDALKEIAKTEKYQYRPWLVWLDYDGGLDETAVEDLRFVIENAPPQTTLITTFDAKAHKYGKPKQRLERLTQLLGAVVPDECAPEELNDDKMAETLAKLLTNFLVSTAARIVRPGGFVPCFSVTYQDGTPMTTVGGVLPTPGTLPQLRQIVSRKDWSGFLEQRITAPHLTLKEAATLQAELPRTTKLSRKSIQRLGFDLEEEQISSFEKYYKYYPSYVQIST